MIPADYPAGRKRRSILDRVVQQPGDYITAPIYDLVADASEWDDTADRVGFTVKDGIWANIPGELSS